MIVSRYLSPDRSLALEISQPPGALRVVEVVFRADNRRQTLPGLGLIPRGPVLFSATNDIIVLHEGTSSMGSWPVAFQRAANGAYEQWGADEGDSLGRQLAARLPDTASIARMWIRAVGFVPGQRIEAEAAVSGAGQRIEGRFRFVYDIATSKIETVFVSPEISEIRDYWGRPTWTGSGFFISRDGLIFTAKHVTKGAEAIFVNDFDGRSYRAEVVAQGYYDVALLKVDAGKAPSLIPILPDAELRIGQKLLTVGFPVNVQDPGFFWDQLEFSEGSLSALRSQDGAGEDFQFSTPIRPGNSGGAIIFENGSLAGIALASVCLACCKK
jgi:S1-C subfamily serine protease